MITLCQFMNTLEEIDDNSAPNMEIDLQEHLEEVVERFLENKLDVEPTWERKVEVLTLMLVMMKAGNKLDLDPIGKPVGMEC